MVCHLCLCGFLPFSSVSPVLLLTDCRTNGTDPRYTLELPTPAQVKVRLQPHAPLFVKVALLPGTGGVPLASSGAFTDAHSGAATAQVALRAGNYLVEPTVDGAPYGDGTFSMVVYSSSAGIRLSPL